MPEELPAFFEAITQGKGEFINGSRLVYPMEDEAMRTLNRRLRNGWIMLKMCFIALRKLRWI